MKSSCLALLLLLPLASQASADGESPQQLFQKAENARRAGKRDDAVVLYQQVILADPENVLAHKYYQEMMIALGKEADILQYYKELLASSPNKAAYHLLLGKLLKDEDAVKEYRKCVELDPKYFWGHWALGGMLLRMKQGEEADKEAQIALDLKDNAFSRTLLGAVEVNKAMTDRDRAAEHLQKSVQALQRAIALDEHYDPAWDALGRVYAAMGHYDEAIKALEMGQKQNPSEPAFGQDLASVWSRLGGKKLDAAREIGLKRQDAEQKIEEQISKGVRPSREAEAKLAQEMVGLRAQAQILAREAVSAFRKVLEYAPGAAEANVNLSHALFVTANLDIMEVEDLTASSRYDEAVSKCQEALKEMDDAAKTDPSNDHAKRGRVLPLLARSNAYYGLGKTLQEAGKKAEAIAAFGNSVVDAQACASEPGVDKALADKARKVVEAAQAAIEEAKR